ncbi:MAG: ABC transporter ATP-binding protein [Candidatus Thermoplasmatota archaeon]|nr:ABC transporter ATP-binding protein [Candidatus Thermoplasmatota archaeon]
MITVKNLTKRYGKITALNNVSFDFPDSQVIAIMGENGAGKSTLLKILTGIIPFDSGEVFIDDLSIVKESVKSREKLGYLPEMPEMYERLTGREFLFYIASLRNIQNAEEKINNITKNIDIYDFLDYEIGTYSKGMKQKISITSAIMHNPANLLLDEPVYGLDPLTAKKIQEFIKQQKGTTIIATHSTKLVEQVANGVYIIERGKVILFDEVKTLLKQYGSIEEA